MPTSPPWRHDRAARDDRAATRDEDATARDERAVARDDAAQVRDTTAVTRDEEFLNRALRLRQLLTDAESRHVGEDARREQLAREHPAGHDLAAAQAEIDRETRRSERAADAADGSALRAGLDWLHDTYLRNTRRDRLAAANDRARSGSDRTTSSQDRAAADADRQQSAVEDAGHN
ncbi:MAG TPA: hypothetical protein VJ851_17290 [Jatrophihabitans sp.]|nr:hypothetical protein [Jatrophihabitans sp.]